MPRVGFDELPPEARLWIFAAERPLTDPERARVTREVDDFIDRWAAHDVPLTAARDVRYRQFIFVAVDERAAGASGCSVDALVRRMKDLQAELGVELVNHAPVLYREGAGIERVSRERFADMAENGAVSPGTVVFDNTLTRVEQVRAGRWELPAGESWHGGAFFR